MIRLVLLGAIVAGIISLAFPITQHCFSGQKCGGVTITFATPSKNHCVGTIQRPLVAKLAKLNLYYRFSTGC